MVLKKIIGSRYVFPSLRQSKSPEIKEDAANTPQFAQHVTPEEPEEPQYEAQLIEAAKNGDLKQVQHLCSAIRVNPDTRGYMGWTAAHWAAREGHIPILEYLKEIGANLDCLDRKVY